MAILTLPPTQEHHPATHLHADTAPDAQLLREGRNLRVHRDLDAELAHPDDRAGLFALLPASLRLALVRADDGDTRLLVRLLGGSVARHSGKKEEKVRNQYCSRCCCCWPAGRSLAREWNRFPNLNQSGPRLVPLFTVTK